MENARVRYATKKRIQARLPNIKEQLAKRHIEALFIAPYVPMLNPTELCFSLLRQRIEKQITRSYEELKDAIEKAIELLNKKDLSKYFWHCANYFEKKKINL